MSLDPNVWGRLFQDDEPATDGPQPIPGFRFSRVGEDRDGYYLAGLGSGRKHIWTPGRNLATCRAGQSHRVPSRLCTCGFHACPHLDTLIQVVGVNDQVLHAVIGSGQVVIHERGWRSEYGEIIALANQVPARIVRHKDGRILRITTRVTVDSEALQGLKNRYRVPLVSVRELEDIVNSRRS